MKNEDVCYGPLSLRPWKPRDSNLKIFMFSLCLDAPGAQDFNANLVRAQVSPPSHDINANYAEPSYLIKNGSLEKDISAPIKMKEEQLNNPTLMRTEAVSAPTRMTEDQLIPQTLKRTDVVSTQTRMGEEQITSTLRTEAVSASNRMREEQLNTTTLIRREAVSAPTRMTEEQLIPQTLKRIDVVSTPAKMREKQLNTPTLKRTEELPNMSSNKENEFSFLSKQREDNVKDSFAPLPGEPFKRFNTSRARAQPGETTSAARSSKHTEVNLDIQGYPFRIRFQRRLYVIY